MFHMYSWWVEQVWYLDRDHASMDLLVAFCHALETIGFSAGEHMGELHTLYILHHGVAVRKRAIIRPPAVWGEDFVVENAAYLERVGAFAVTCVEVLSMSRGRLQAILLRLPREEKTIRHAVVRFVVR